MPDCKIQYIYEKLSKIEHLYMQGIILGICMSIAK